MVKPGWMKWTHEVHADWKDIFCSAGWVFNRDMPLTPQETYFAPWIYIPQFSIRLNKLSLVIPHLCPLYYQDLQKYIFEAFENNPLDNMHPHAVQHFEIDGLLQRVLLQNKMQVAWSSIAQVQHAGFAGYNRGGVDSYEEFFCGEQNFMKRVDMVEAFIADETWRATVFGKEIVEREVGHELVPKKFRYKMILPGGWESEFESDGPLRRRPKRVNSVNVTADTEFVVVS
jgi:hypothetical protein